MLLNLAGVVVGKLYSGFDLSRIVATFLMIKTTQLAQSEWFDFLFGPRNDHP